MFKVGQKVWCLIYGQGVVTEEVREKNSLEVYNVVVRFTDERLVSYTSDGKYHTEGNVTLFPHPVEVIKSAAKPSIDWSHVSSEYNYLIQDSDGEGYLCGEKPSRVKSGWIAESANISASTFTSYEPGTCDWQESLVKRPS